jgi:hypothetical protein
MLMAGVWETFWIGFFTLGLGRLVGVETLTRSKVLAVFAR